MERCRVCTFVEETLRCNVCGTSSSAFMRILERNAKVKAIDPLDIKNAHDGGPVDYKAKCEELEGEIEFKQSRLDNWNDVIYPKLTAQLELLTRCAEPSRCPERESYNKCHGCKSKALLERGE